MGEHKLKTNGAADQQSQNPASSSGLGEAIHAHAQALVKANTVGNGMLAINPMQLFCDQELMAVRLEVLFESMVEAGLIDPAKLTVKLRDKLLAEVEQLNAAPQIEIARGSIPRNG